MKFHNYSTPKVKIRINNVRYVISGGTVHCFITMDEIKRDEPYMKLIDTANAIGIDCRRHTDFKLKNDRTWFYLGLPASSCDKYYYIPSDYEYHGAAVLKSGDTEDYEEAKRIAYKKAYRQLTSFYYNCYVNLYDAVLAYTRDVWYGQICQLSERWTDTECNIVDRTRQ